MMFLCIVIDKIYQINTDCRSVSKNIHAVYLNCYLLEGYGSDKCCYPLWIYMAPRLFNKYKIENSYYLNINENTSRKRIQELP